MVKETKKISDKKAKVIGLVSIVIMWVWGYLVGKFNFICLNCK